jgi:hypothetical protein
MSRPADYLAVPEEYVRALGGLRWADNGEAIVLTARDPEIGLTFAMAPEIARFLAGFRQSRDLVPFAYVLHMLSMLNGQGTARQPLAALATAYRELRRPVWCAGALFGALCRDVPRATDSPDLKDLLEFLTSWPVGPNQPAPGTAAELPSLEPREFEDRILRALEPLSDEDIRHWLKHGRGLLPDVGESVAREAIAVRPPNLLETLEAVSRRPRLERAAPLVAHLAGALALPTRRLAEAAPPSGGYADIATRGRPEQILPGQLALDDLEFLRRFAAQELLYYHRETPRATTNEEIVLVIDQGVRTWGDVRLVLAAAGLALARTFVRRGRTLRIATTGTQGQAKALEGLGEEAIGALLEASDLSPHPGVALETILEGPSEGLRDVVLLTHPRNLTEAGVAGVARRVAVGTRLFAVAVDAHGEVQLAELRQGTPVPLGRCRVSLADPTAPPAETIIESPGTWRGDIEPAGSPVPAGNDARPYPFYEFDDAAEWLLASLGRDGLLVAWRLDDGTREVLPRASLGGRPVTGVAAIAGVAGGFVVAGSHADELVAAHYNLSARTCTVHRLEAFVAQTRSVVLCYHRKLHAAVLRDPSDPSWTFGVDLGADRNFACFRAGDPRAPVSARAKRAVVRACPQRVLIISPRGSMHGDEFTIRLDKRTGMIEVRMEAGSRTQFTPLSNGQPALPGGHLLQARCGGSTLAVLARDAHRHATLYCQGSLNGLCGPFTENLAAYPANPPEYAFALSADGRRIARQVKSRHIEVRDVGSVGPPQLLTSPRDPAM